MPKIISETLWELAAADVQKRQSEVGEEDRSVEPSERTVFLIGSKAGGKTSILYRCLDKDEPPKPTLALEYSFGRRTKGHNTISFCDSCLGSIKTQYFVGTMERLLQAAQDQTEKAFHQAQQKAGSKQTTFVQQARILPKDYPDRELISPFPVPLLIIGSKYDLFQESTTLRFIAHYYAASLIFTSIKSESLMSKTKSFFSHFAFGVDKGKTVSTDSTKPLMIPAGADSFSQIGTPPTSDVTSLHAKNPKDLWKKVYECIFPQETVSEQRELKDPAKDPQYSEPQIDAMRAQKDQELEQYKRNAAKSWKALNLES
ncbi:hypothetical protein WMY93_018841 [Mugilogobius chulae]|uniref:Cytoplasmic dynein 2 light intermediate chain 1 n=1 Tax=Mugilogobius chulae TaxID=88201 RepID=A0AAW0NVA8_9GOBI